MQKDDTPTHRNRRGFLARLGAVAGGVLALLAPAASALMLVCDPLRRKAQGTGLVPVTTLEALPNDGVPRKFNVLADRVDAWNTYHGLPVGAVYLRRTGETQVSAFNVICPHAGCSVEFVSVEGQFRCPCHNSRFAVDGGLQNPSGLSPRGLDALEVEIRKGKEVWVRFQNFQTGRKEKVPTA